MSILWHVAKKKKCKLDVVQKLNLSCNCCLIRKFNDDFNTILQYTTHDVSSMKCKSTLCKIVNEQFVQFFFNKQIIAMSAKQINGNGDNLLVP